MTPSAICSKLTNLDFLINLTIAASINISLSCSINLIILSFDNVYLVLKSIILDYDVKFQLIK